MTQAPSLREPTTPYAPLQPPVREAIANAAPPASATAALGPQTVASPGVGPAPQNAAAPIDVAVLPTRTAPPPVYASHPAAPTSPNPAISPTHAPAKWPYGAAALAAVVVSGVGLWLTQASSILALILVPVASITAAAVTAMVATRLADLRRR